ncbi:unnamed protein product [Nezara viridula]|uniref:Uncharacterized protein n=1 Tax=Nezara viridula TaxID=85310 RepID=A0A9P0MVW9_NEZVI|nr:unnamed protein product [Nezara viridula]
MLPLLKCTIISDLLCLVKKMCKIFFAFIFLFLSFQLRLSRGWSFHESGLGSFIGVLVGSWNGPESLIINLNRCTATSCCPAYYQCCGGGKFCCDLAFPMMLPSSDC